MDKPVLAALLSVEGTKLSDDEKYLFHRYNPLGVTLFNRNSASKNQLKELIKSIKDVTENENIFIAVDQEGGRVNRMKAAGFPNYASEKTLGLINKDDITALHSALIAKDLRSVGINFNYAPVLDIEYPTTTTALKGRCFGAAPALIAHHGKIMTEAYLESGICPCMKHLPGHGRAECDPHLGLPIINKTVAELADDFYPFRRLNHCPAAMTAHILLSKIDDKNPITFSKVGIEKLIRGEIGFKGLLISDSIDMLALRGSLLEKAQAAWNAGCDVVCYCGGRIYDNSALCEQGRFLSDFALEQVSDIVKHIFKNDKLINLDHHDNRYYTLVSQYNEDVNYDATEVLHQMQKGEK